MANPASAATPMPKVRQKGLARLFHSTTNSHITHLNRVLSTASGVDTTLILVQYTLTLVHSQLHRILNLNLRRLVTRLAANASKSVRPGDTVVATVRLPGPTSRLANMAASTKGMASMISDVRTFLRLWGLLGVYAWARGTYYDGPADPLLRSVAWAQIAANTAYYVLEHGAYLASKNILRDWSAAKQARWWLWSGRCFAGHVALDYVRLLRTRQLRDEAREMGEEKEDKMEARRLEAAWWRELVVNAAYSPLVVHWSLESGYVSEAWVGALGTVAGFVGFREAWRKTA